MSEITNINEAKNENVEVADIGEKNVTSFINEDIPDTYSVNFTMSYTQYIKAKGHDRISDAEAASLVTSVASYYENEANPDEVRGFFEIPEVLADKIANREYNIAIDVTSVEHTNQVILVNYTLKIGERAGANNIVGADGSVLA